MPKELTIKLTAEGVNEMKVSMITRRGIGSEASQDRVLIGGHVLCDEEFFGEFDKPCAVGIADGVGECRRRCCCRIRVQGAFVSERVHTAGSSPCKF